MIVITGATGNVGTPLVKALAAAGKEVTAVSRRPSDLPGHRQGDLTEPESLKPALEGAEALFVLISGDFVAAGGDLGHAMKVARAAGVQRVVLLSSQGVGTGHHPTDLEDVVKESGMAWTMLRPGAFDSNALQWAELVRTQRTVAAPFADVALPTVDPADIADVAAVALRDGGHAGATYDLTGPAATSPREQAAAIGEAVGESLRFVELTRAEAKAAMTRFMPERVAESSLDLLGTPPPAVRRPSPDVERILGRPARPFADWAARNAAAFR